jgi:DNA repair photolyase
MENSEDRNEMPVRQGRATRYNTPNQFEPLHVIMDPGELDQEELRQVKTEFFYDSTKSILSRNDSPDIPFMYSINPYRGCEHGCIYCYARPSHEYLGFSAGLDFETKILVKPEAPRLLAEALQRQSWVPQLIVFSGNTDCYQPLERKMRITRQCLEICLHYRNPAAIITKNQLITRDIDVLEQMAEYNLVHVTVSITSLKPEITAVMEPRTARPSARLKVIEELAAHGISVGVNVAPIIPGLTDEEMPAILKAAAEKGAKHAGYTIVRFPGAVKELFLDWLRQTYPKRAQKIINRLTDLRGPALTDSRWGKRQRGEGLWADLIDTLFNQTCQSLGLNQERITLETKHFRRLKPGQHELF